MSGTKSVRGRNGSTTSGTASITTGYGLVQDAPDSTTPHHFVFEGKLGHYRVPVAFHLLRYGVPSPREWNVGAPRLSETEWVELEETLISAFLNWPRTSATGYRPLWIEFDRGYREGA